MFVYNPVPAVRSDPAREVLEPEPFFPPTERDGDLMRMHVVFPDGSQATIVYPIPLGLELMGVQPDQAYAFRGGTRAGSSSSDRTPRSSDSWIRRGDRPSSTRRRVDSSCGPLGVTITISGSDSSSVLDGARADRGRGLESFGRVGRSRRRRGQFLAHPETASGFPSSARLGMPSSQRGSARRRAQLAFGDAATEPDMVSQLDATIFFSPDGCTSAVDSGPSGVRGDLPRRWSSVREHLRKIASSSPASSMIFASRICARRDVPHGGPADPSLASHACRSGNASTRSRG